MAGRKKVEVETSVEEVEVVETKKKVIDVTEKIIVRSIASWGTSCARKTSVGDIVIQPNGFERISREEVIAQVHSGNRLLSGIDGMGTHATWFIDDEWTRNEVGFVDQDVLNNDKIKELFAIKNQAEFERAIEESVVTRAEKVSLIEAIPKLKLNDYYKISFCERYTSVKVQP